MAKLPKRLIIFLASTLIVLVILFATVFISLHDRFYPRIYLSGTDLTFQTLPQAQASLSSLLSQRTSNELNFRFNNQVYSIDLSSENQNLSPSLQRAFEYGHQKPYFSPVYLSAIETLSPEVKNQISLIAQQINQPPLDSSISVNNTDITTTPSQNGIALDTDSLTQDLLNYLNSGTPTPPTLPTKKVPPKLSYQAALNLKKELDTLKLSPLILNFKDKTFTLDLPTVLSLIDLQKTQSNLARANFFGIPIALASAQVDNQKISNNKISLDQDKLKSYLENLSSQINQPVKEPLLNYDPSSNSGQGKITQFQPPQEGYTLNIPASENLISQRLIASDFSPLTLPVNITPPKNKLVNDLGIKDLLAEGVSHFDDSIPNRIWNVELAASRINGSLVPPGGTFSFNDAVGEVSGATGYKEGYIISNGKTVLDDGGGVCQDSTTLFRAVLKAGLPVVDRTAHAYRVGYYEQDSPPGFDATVYSPSVDFKFKNDTPGYILIQTRVENNDTLYYDLYGTSDGRVATITTPVILSTTPALPDVRQDDPTLPKGQIKQVDFAVAGADVVFSRTVTRGGQTLINETYNSNYHPWANIYLVGTQ